VLGWRLGARDAIEADVRRRIEANGAPPAKIDRIARAGLRDQRLGAIGIDCFRPLPAEAENDRLVGRVALSGEGERAVERDE
jgi:hypothetical protein